jgi:hypothetical protein
MPPPRATRAQRRRIEPARHHVVGEDAGQRGAVRGLQQLIDRAGRQRFERPIDGREHGEGAISLQRFDQAGSRDGRDQRGVIGRIDGVVDDGLVRQHRLAADHGLCARAPRHGSEQERRGDQAAQ